jgi:SAF domain
VAARQGVEQREGVGSAGGSVPATARRRRVAAPVEASPSGRPSRRQWGRVAIGLSVSLVGGWLFAALYLAAGGREPVVVVAREVDRFQEIQEGDLTTDRVAAGDQVRTIAGGEVDELVGRVAATELSPGMVLTTDHVLEDESQLIGPTEAVVSALLEAGSFPELTGGNLVELVIVSDDTDGDAVEDTIPGRVLAVREPEQESDARNGDRDVDFVVPRNEADEAQAAAHQGRLTVTHVTIHGG